MALFSLGPSDDAPDWLTGGDFGIEGSATATVLLLVAVGVAWRYYQRYQPRGVVGTPHAAHG
ncbi:hypothetical protein [Jiangella endophytica]|uniref:hypothetical protein n=1 Tax=Jiangella endophytica TaxID=1623398 RepID=UPI000E34FC88|nr:hypothetical protein [Jiangella endophytica]